MRVGAVLALVVLAIAVGIFIAWQWGVFVIVVAVFVSSFGYLAGVSMEGTTRWSRALYGNDPEDENHWSRRHDR